MASNDPYNPAYREINIVLHWLARFCFWLIGWKVTGPVPQAKKLVAIAAPHTSNFDGFLLILTSWIIRRKLLWMVKIEWTRPPIIGHFLRWTGALGVDRSGSFNTVEQAIKRFEQSDTLALLIPPEGTRKKTDHWKTGFYWIALGAKVPLVLALVDYGNKKINMEAPLFYPTGDIVADMQYIWSNFEGVVARHPERISAFRMRPSGMRPMGQQENEDEESSFQDASVEG